MLIKRLVPIAAFALITGLLAGTPILAQGPNPAPTVASTTMFVANVQVVSNNDRSPDVIQDVKGVVLSSDGKGLEGITVKVTSPGWQAFDVTKGGGTFKFSLTKGDFVVRLESVPSQDAKIVVDGKSEINIRFTESSVSTPTPVLPTVTATATVTPTMTSTPAPTRTPVLAIFTPVNSGFVSTPTSVAASTAELRKTGNDLSLEGGMRIFLAGAGFGLIAVCTALVVVVVRRNRS